METLSKILNEYLLKHEEDIANNIDDFGSLKSIFEFMLGYKARTYDEKINEEILTINNLESTIPKNANYCPLCGTNEWQQYTLLSFHKICKNGHKFKIEGF
jgi:hypothetical protein